VPFADQRIRPIAICVFRNRGRILAIEGYDPTKDETFYRPVGGALRFGERSVDALHREVAEELEVELCEPVLLGVLENLFTFDGAPGHEIVFVYDGKLPAPTLYGQPTVTGIESDGQPFTAVWREPEWFTPGRPPLYPDGLAELLGQQP